jgi:hypothetical protein
MKIDYTNISEPEWLKDLADDSCLGMRDLINIFKVNQKCLEQRIYVGTFPKPDFSQKSVLTRNHIWQANKMKKNLWHVSTIKKFFKEIKNASH